MNRNICKGTIHNEALREKKKESTKEAKWHGKYNKNQNMSNSRLERKKNRERECESIGDIIFERNHYHQLVKMNEKQFLRFKITMGSMEDT